MNTKDLIFNELSDIEKLLEENYTISDNSQDLEITILNKQIQTLKDKNLKASEFIDKSIAVLKNIK